LRLAVADNGRRGVTSFIIAALYCLLLTLWLSVLFVVWRVAWFYPSAVVSSLTYRDLETILSNLASSDAIVGRSSWREKPGSPHGSGRVNVHDDSHVRSSPTRGDKSRFVGQVLCYVSTTFARSSAKTIAPSSTPSTYATTTLVSASWYSSPHATSIITTTLTPAVVAMTTVFCQHRCSPVAVLFSGARPFLCHVYKP
jgi:hypothetical protein